MAMDPDALRRELSKLSEEYARSIPEKLASIESLWRSLRSEAQSGQCPSREPLIRLAHTIAGSAKTFGFAALSDAARALEFAIVRAGEPGAPGIALEAQRIDALVEAVRHSVADSQ